MLTEETASSIQMKKVQRLTEALQRVYDKSKKQVELSVTTLSTTTTQSSKDSSEPS